MGLWGLFHKPLNKDLVLNQPGFNGKAQSVMCEATPPGHWELPSWGTCDYRNHLWSVAWWRLVGCPWRWKKIPINCKDDPIFEELFGDEKGDNRCFYCYFIQNFVWRVHIPKFPPVILNNYWELQDTVFFPKKKIMGLPSCKTDVKSLKVEKGELKAFSKNSKVDRLPVLFLFWWAFFGIGKRWYPPWD